MDTMCLLLNIAHEIKDHNIVTVEILRWHEEKKVLR